MSDFDPDLWPTGRQEFFVICQAYCGKRYTVYIDPEDYAVWKSGEAFVQDAFPYLTAAERELLMTQVCGECFDRMFPEEDE